jgi:hypothetical protein
MADTRRAPDLRFEAVDGCISDSGATRASVPNLETLRAGLAEGRRLRTRFGCAVRSTILGEISERVAALRGVPGALKARGFVLVNEEMRGPHHQSLAEVKALAGEAGFQIGTFRGNRLAFSINLEKQFRGSDPR